LEIEIDGTKKNCAGVIAELEKNISKAKEDDTIIAIVKSIPDKIDIYAWAERKKHRIIDDTDADHVYKIKIMK
jgi:TusA-related sulfurtransferase